MDVRRVLFVLAAVAYAALAAAPAVVVFSLGWLVVFPAARGATGQTGSSPEAWVAFALFYLVWMLGLSVLLIIVNERLGRHWHAWDRPPRAQKKRRRRLIAGLRLLEGQDDAPVRPARVRAHSAAAQRRPRAPGHGPGAKRRGST